MSLRTFHIVFIVASIAMSFLVGVWGVLEYRRDANLTNLLIGIGFGAWSGYRGGWADALVQRLIEIFLCFPALFFVLAVLSFVGNSTLGVVLVLALVYWTSFARIVRGEFLSLREREFVQSLPSGPGAGSPADRGERERGVALPGVLRLLR